MYCSQPPSPFFAVDMCSRAPYYRSLLRTVREITRHPGWGPRLLTEQLPSGHTLMGVLAQLAAPATQFVRVRS